MNTIVRQIGYLRDNGERACLTDLSRATVESIVRDWHGMDLRVSVTVGDAQTQRIGYYSGSILVPRLTSDVERFSERQEALQRVIAALDAGDAAIAARGT